MNPFEEYAKQTIPNYPQESEKAFSNPFEEYASREANPDESWLKSSFRTGYQAISAFLSTTAPGIAGAFWQLLAAGEVNDPEEIDRIEMMSRRLGVPFDREKYDEAAQTAMKYIPSVPNLERIIEENIGLPLQAKTPLQKGINLAGQVGRLTPGTLSQKAIAGGAAPAISQGLQQELGVPELIADVIGGGAGGFIGAKTPPIKTPVLISAKKASGLPVRQYEKLTEPREVSPKKFAKIEQKVENDFKKIADEIFKESPFEKTKNIMDENPFFKQEVGDQFKKVETLAEKMPEKINSSEITKSLLTKAEKNKGIGFVPGEYEKDYQKFIKNAIEETPTKEITPIDLVKQYRKNNKALSEYYDPGKSYAHNRAKKEAILDYNKAIADVIETKFPETEFSNLFKDTNKQWSQIADAEAMNKYVEGLFEGKIQYGKGRKFFDNENISRPFKRQLGEVKFKQFETLMKDMVSTEKAAKMLKIAKQKGFSGLVEDAGHFIIHPNLGKAKIGYNFLKKGYTTLINSFLDKPQFEINWRDAVGDLKKAKFAEAQKKFHQLRKEVE
jgi:hypothetical protein